MIRIGLPGSTPVVQRRCACGGTPGPEGECAACKAKRLQRAAVGAGPQVAPPIVHEVLGSAGRPLEPGVRGEMEARFGHDFSQVRVHTDVRAAASARAVEAAAYTVGNSVVFGAERFSPGTVEGRSLLAHELAHTVQQRGATAAAEPVAAGSGLEASAEAAGRAAGSGHALTQPMGASGLAVARQPVRPDEAPDPEDNPRIAEARRRAEAQFEWMLAIPPPAFGDDAPMLIAWAEKSAQRFANPATSDSARGYIAVGLMKAFADLKEFESRAKRAPDGALLHALGGDVPWTKDRPHSVDDLPVFSPEAVERWQRVAAFAAAEEEAEETPRGRRPPPRKPVRIASPTGREVEITRSPNTVTFPKPEDLDVDSDAGQAEIIWLHVASTHPGLTKRQINWLVSQLGVKKKGDERRLTAEWRSTFKAAKPGEQIKVTSDPEFERDVSRALVSTPSEQSLELEEYRQGVLDARGGVILGYGTVAVGSAAFTAGAGIGTLGALGGEVAMSGIGAGGVGFVGGETASFGSFVAAGGRFVLTEWYLHPQIPILYGSAITSGIGLGEQTLRIREQGFHSYEVGEFFGNILPLAEASVPFLGRSRPSGSSGGGSGGGPGGGGPGGGGGGGGEPVQPDLLIRPTRRDPVTGRVSASITDLGNGRTYDADVDPTTRYGQIVDRRSRAVVGIIDGDDIRRPAAGELSTGEPDVAPSAAGTATKPPPTTGPRQLPSGDVASPTPAPTVAPTGPLQRPGTVTVDDSLQRGIVRPGGKLERILRSVQAEFEAAPPTTLNDGLDVVERGATRAGFVSGIRSQETAAEIILTNPGSITRIRTNGEIIVTDLQGRVVLHLMP